MTAQKNDQTEEFGHMGHTTWQLLIFIMICTPFTTTCTYPQHFQGADPKNFGNTSSPQGESNHPRQRRPPGKWASFHQRPQLPMWRICAVEYIMRGHDKETLKGLTKQDHTLHSRSSSSSPVASTPQHRPRNDCIPRTFLNDVLHRCATFGTKKKYRQQHRNNKGGMH